MDVELNDEVGVMSLHLDREEACLLYFAVRAYCDRLEEDLKKAPNTVQAHLRSTFFEDRAFIYEQLGRNYKFLFDIIDNHIPSERERIRNWIDVI